MATDLVFNMIANSSQFTAGMKQAQKAADSLFLATATGAEKYAVELDNLQRIAHLTNLDPKVFGRAHETLVKKYDPFGVQAEERARLASIQRVADFRERLAERSGRALIREAQQEAQQEARIASIAQAGGIGGNRAMIIQQLAFAAEDAATQFGTRGFAGALMAAGNNLTFAASMAHPAVGVFTSLALTGTMVYQIYSKWAEETKRVAEENNKLETVLTRVKSGLQDYFAFRDTLNSQSSFPESSKADQKYVDEAESNNRQLAVLASKRSQLMEETTSKAQEYSGSLYKRLNPFEMYNESDRRFQAQKQMNDLIAEESRLKIQATTLESRGEQIRLAANQKANEELAAIKDDQDWQQHSREYDEAASMTEKLKTSEDRYHDQVSRINMLKERGLILDPEAIELKNRLLAPDRDVLGGAMDIRSAGAGGLVAETYAKMSLIQQRKDAVSPPSPVATGKSAFDEKVVTVLEKILNESRKAGKKFNLDVVGLN